jgi:hypothetical protein
MNFNVIPLILSIIQGCNPNRRVFICFENAGSTKPLFQEYMLKAVGVQVEGSKVINSKRWTQVSRNRLFITNATGFRNAATQTPPWENGWTTGWTASRDCFGVTKYEPISLGPWLRTRSRAKENKPVHTTAAYHPVNLVYDTSYFGGEQAFQSLWKIGTCLPEVDWDKFPQILTVKKAWTTLLNWPIKERIRPNEEEDRARDVVATIFHSNNLPFRPPTTKERLKQAELYDLFNSLKVTRSCAAGPVTDDAIWNAFLPSALLGAMHGSAPGGLESHVFKGTAIAHRALKPDACKNLYSKLKDKVAQIIMEDETTILLGKEKSCKGCHSHT